MEQLLNYFQWFREGIALIRNLLGDEVIPSSIKFFEDPRAVMRGLSPDFVGYVIEWNTIAIGVASIVDDAWVSGPNDFIRPKYPGMPEFIFARANVMLVAMEECFHRYQKVVLKRPHEQGTYALNDHPIEVE